jgi:hypothetical protein
VRRSVALAEQELEGAPNMLTMRELAPAPDGDASQPLITVIDRDADTGAETVTRWRMVQEVKRRSLAPRRSSRPMPS